MSFFLNSIRKEVTQANKPKILIPDALSQVAVNYLEDRYDVTRTKDYSPKLRSKMLNHIRNMNGLIWTDALELNKEILDVAGPGLKVISTISTEYNHIDVEEVLKRGIKLGYSPVASSGPADIAILLTLAAMRRFNEARIAVEDGTWTKDIDFMLGQELEDSTVGIVGLGYIGQAIAKRLRGFDVKELLYSDKRKLPTSEEQGAEFLSLNNLVQKSDVIIISCSLNDQTRGLFNKALLHKMKSNAVLVNVAQTEVVDQPALIKALKTKRIFAAGLDVMCPEPLPRSHELLTLSNCVITPHLGSATKLSRRESALVAAYNIIAGLENKPLPSPVLNLLREDESVLKKYAVNYYE